MNLIELSASNDRLMDELEISRKRIDAVRAYLDRPSCNERFGLATLEVCRARHSGVLAMLRANRIKGFRLLGVSDPVPVQGGVA